jgi:hypothetical protein
VPLRKKIVAGSLESGSCWSMISRQPTRPELRCPFESIAYTIGARIRAFTRRPALLYVQITPPFEGSSLRSCSPTVPCV